MRQDYLVVSAVAFGLLALFPSSSLAQSSIAVIVSGAASLVDVQSASSERHLSAELLEAIPASRSPQCFAALTPGIVSAGINTIGGGREEMNLSNHGSRNQ